jgi:hypothetical protein
LGVDTLPFHPDETSWLVQSDELEWFVSDPGSLAYSSGVAITPEIMTFLQAPRKEVSYRLKHTFYTYRGTILPEGLEALGKAVKIVSPKEGEYARRLTESSVSGATVDDKHDQENPHERPEEGPGDYDASARFRDAMTRATRSSGYGISTLNKRTIRF